MKLRLCSWSIHSRILAPDEFGFSVDQQGKPIGIQFCCRGPRAKEGNVCTVGIVRGPPESPNHGWNGNWDEPTITPSIGCDVSPRCGWHGSITKGEILP